MVNINCQMENLMNFNLILMIISIVIGVASISIAISLLILSKDKLYISTLLFFITFSVLIINNTVRDYIFSNNLKTNEMFRIIETLINLFFYRALYFTTPFFIHEIVPVTYKKRRNILFLIITLVIIIINGLYQYANLTQQNKIGSFFIYDLIFLLVIIYLIIISVKNYKKIKNIYFKRICRDFLIIIITSFPFLTTNIIVTFNDLIKFIKIPDFNYYVLIYIILSIVFTIHIMKYYIFSLNLSRIMIPDENLYKKYDITDREKEIISLILKGYNNNKIGETLFISVSTVKKHIYSIFGKTSVKSRYELIALFKNI